MKPTQTDLPTKEERIKEKQWVKSLTSDLEHFLADKKLLVEASKRLPYAWQIQEYHDAYPLNCEATPYETDLLVSDKTQKGWIPRVVVECKLGSFSTHSALTYSAKAS